MRGRVITMLVALTGCSSSKVGQPTVPPDAVAPSVDSAVAASVDSAVTVSVDSAADPGIDPALAARVRGIAADYQAWGRVDDELRWAPFLCRLPQPGRAYVSESTDQTTHGQKLYSVFVKQRNAYPAGPHEDQVVVKESWTSELVTDPAVKYEPDKYREYPDGGDHFYPFARKDGAVYRAGKRAGLYVMFKLAENTPGTDEGWVYATLTADGQLTSAGRVASCMRCHQDAEYGRLFGVPKGP